MRVAILSLSFGRGRSQVMRRFSVERGVEGGTRKRNFVDVDNGREGRFAEGGTHTVRIRNVEVRV